MKNIFTLLLLIWAAHTLGQGPKKDNYFVDGVQFDDPVIVKKNYPKVCESTWRVYDFDGVKVTGKAIREINPSVALLNSWTHSLGHNGRSGDCLDTIWLFFKPGIPVYVNDKLISNSSDTAQVGVLSRKEVHKGRFTRESIRLWTK
jgi:hypothetical protein